MSVLAEKEEWVGAGAVDSLEEETDTSAEDLQVMRRNVADKQGFVESGRFGRPRRGLTTNKGDSMPATGELRAQHFASQLRATPSPALSPAFYRCHQQAEHLKAKQPRGSSGSAQLQVSVKDPTSSI